MVTCQLESLCYSALPRWKHYCMLTFYCAKMVFYLCGHISELIWIDCIRYVQLAIKVDLSCDGVEFSFIKLLYTWMRWHNSKLSSKTFWSCSVAMCTYSFSQNGFVSIVWAIYAGYRKTLIAIQVQCNATPIVHCHNNTTAMIHSIWFRSAGDKVQALKCYIALFPMNTAEMYLTNKLNV